MRHLIATLVFVFLTTLFASAEEYHFNSRKSKVGFEIGYVAGTAVGRFDQFEGTLRFDPENPGQSKVSITIQVKSINTDSAKRDRHLQEEEYFDSRNHPTITFESASFRKVGAQEFVVAGPLTIRGVSKPVTLHLRLERRQQQWAVKGEALNFSCEYELNRTDFGVNGGRPGVSDQLKVMLRIEALES